MTNDGGRFAPSIINSKSIESLNSTFVNRHLSFQKGEHPMSALITCPVCGKRNGYEFRYGGVDKGPRPAEEVLSPATWCDYIHMNKCVAGIQKEWWFHRDGCGAWFTTYRDTTTNLEVEKPEVN